MNEQGTRMARVTGVMRSVFALPPGVAIERSTSSADIDGWDSLSHSLLILAVEEEFGIDLPLDKTFELQNVGELVDLLETVGAGA